MSTPSRARRLFPRLLLAGGAVGLLLIGLNFVGNVMSGGPQQPEGAPGIPMDLSDIPALEPDDELGWTLAPSTETVWGEHAVRSNSLGLRADEPNGEPGVVVVGDSSAFGDGVPQDATFSTGLARRVVADVQNAGLPGFTCLQSLAKLRRVTTSWTPEILVVYSLHSDARRAGANDRIVVEHQLGWLGETGVGQLLADAALKLRVARGGSNLDLPAYEACLHDLADEVEKTFFVVPVSQRSFEELAHDGPDMLGGAEDRVTAYERTIEQVAMDRGLPFLRAGEALVSQGLDAETAMLDPIHPNEAGHAGIAEALAGELLELRWVAAR